MKINDEVLHPMQHNDDHMVFVKLNSTKHHLEQLECTAIYNTKSITAQATIYVLIMTYKAPSVILPNKLIEGTPGSISCLVEDRRPAADNITMRIGGNLVEAVVTVQESSITGTLYNTWVTVTEIQRAWNKKNVTCCEYNTRFWTDGFKMCSKETDDVISYIFPPASVKLTLQMENNITGEKPFTILIATCSIEDSNPKCDASWDTSNIKIMTSGEEKSTQNIDNGSITSIYVAFMNVSASDDGKVITCSPNCTTEFNNMPSSSVVIRVLGHSVPPASVKLTLQMENNITKEKPFTILKATCSIEDSNPKCDASWDTSNIKIMVSGEEKSTQNIDNGSITSIYVAFMNVSASDDGKVITCSPNCTTEFNNMPSSSVVIRVLGHSESAPCDDNISISAVIGYSVGITSGCFVLTFLSVFLIWRFRLKRDHVQDNADYVDMNLQ
ncbi:hypothetical protein ACF0H5_012584 [Mactra antiquata]